MLKKILIDKTTLAAGVVVSSAICPSLVLQLDSICFVAEEGSGIGTTELYGEGVDPAASCDHDASQEGDGKRHVHFADEVLVVQLEGNYTDGVSERSGVLRLQQPVKRESFRKCLEQPLGTSAQEYAKKVDYLRKTLGLNSLQTKKTGSSCHHHSRPTEKDFQDYLAAEKKRTFSQRLTNGSQSAKRKLTIRSTKASRLRLKEKPVAKNASTTFTGSKVAHKPAAHSVRSVCDRPNSSKTAKAEHARQPTRAVKSASKIPKPPPGPLTRKEHLGISRIPVLKQKKHEQWRTAVFPSAMHPYK